jgi:hypothetical protein
VTHNYFELPACSSSLRITGAQDGAAAGDSALSIVVQSPGLADQELGPIPLTQLPTAIGPAQQFTIPLAFSGQVGRVRFAVIGTTGSAAAHITGVSATPCTTSCYANCDGSTNVPLLTANDFQCFLNQFALGASYANCDQSTVAPTLTPNDFQCFLNAYAAGCP